jgi:lysophospholipase L1-like esterase
LPLKLASAIVGNMNHVSWLWWLKRLAYLFLATVVGTYLLGAWLSAAAPTDPAPAWANPRTMALRRVSSIGTAQGESILLNNLDCFLVDYRLVATSTMQTGCFTQTAFGLFDSDNDVALFSGTDEGLPLLPYAAGEVLAAWPKALNLVVLDAVGTGGSRLSLYTSPLAGLEDRRNLLGQLTAKQLTRPPDLPLRDRLGQALVVNPQSIAFSDSGSWLVAETLNGSFVRINLATLDMVAFAPAFGSQGSPALLKSRVTISDDGHYMAIANDAATSLKIYDLTTCQGSPINLEPLNCQSYDYRPFINSQIAGIQSIRHPRFVNEGLLSFEVTANSGGGIYELAPVDRIDSLIDYLGLGDSYTSGEGAFDYLSGTDSGENRCHLSSHSYPLLLTHDLFSSRGGHSVACSGAVINDVGSTSDNYRGQVRNGLSFKQLQATPLYASVMTNFLPGNVAQQRFVRQYQPAITTVSVGGNDIGFGSIVGQCVAPHISLHASDNTCFNTYEDRQELLQLIDRTVLRWTALYRQLAAAAPSGHIYVIGYPQVAVDTGSCALNVHLNRSELEFVIELINYLNGAIQQAAERAGVNYVDISQALVGHRLCETASHNVAVNGLTAGTDAGPFGHESYHPNALGHELIEQAILKQTHNLTLVTPPTGTKPSGATLLNAPKSGRAVTTRVPTSTLGQAIVKAGQATTLTINGSDAGLKTQTVYQVRLDGASGPVIGTLTSDEVANAVTVVTIPQQFIPGVHTLDVTGQNQAGETVDITQPIYIPVSDSDADGDNLPDTSDTCPTVVDSGHDDDQDGVDDACDGFISQVTNETTPPTITGSVSVAPATAESKTSPLTEINQRVANVLGATTINPTSLARPVKKSSSTPYSLNPGSADPVPVTQPIQWFRFWKLFWLYLLLLAVGCWLGRQLWRPRWVDDP